MIKRILVGTRASGRADAAVLTATALAKSLDAELVVLRLEPVIDARHVFDPDAVPRSGEASVVQALPASGVRVRSRRARGSAVRTVCEVAEHEGADLIVVPHGRPGDGDVLLPKRASKALVERAPCPVLLVAS